MNLLQERLKELRKEKRLTQAELADIIKTTQKTISDYERGISNPDLETLTNFANFFDVSTDYLLGKTNDRKAKVPTPSIDLSQLDSIDIALFNASHELSTSEKTQVMDFVNYIKNKNPSEEDGK